MRVLLCLLIIFLTFGRNAFGQKPFHISVNIKHEEHFDYHQFIVFDNGEYVIAEWEQPDLIRGNTIFSRFDACHNLLWRKKIENSRGPILKTENEGLLCISHSQFSYFDIGSAALVKLDKYGNTVWSKIIANKSRITSLCNTSNGNYLVSGYLDTTENNVRKGYSFVCRLDTSGKILWSFKFNLALTSSSFKMFPTNDDGAILMAGGVLYDQTIIRLRSSGSVLWSKRIVPMLNLPFNYQNFNIREVITDKDNNFYCIGDLTKETVPYIIFHHSFPCIFKIDNNGQAKWCKVYTDTTFTDYRHISDVVMKMDNSFVVSVISPVWNTALLNIDTSGKILRENYYALNKGLNEEIAVCLDSGLLTTGYLYDGENKTSIIKTDKYQKTSCSIPDSVLREYKSSFLTKDDKPVLYQGIYTRDTFIQVLDYKIPLKIKLLCGKEDYAISDLGSDTILCNTKSYTLRAGEANLGYNHKFMWSNGSSDSVLTVTKSGKYWLAISSGYCTNIDTVNIVFREEIKSNIADQSICPYDSVLVKAPDISAANFYWIKPEKSIFKQHNIWAKDTGTYYLMLDGNGNCLNIDTFRIQHHKLPQASAGPDTVLCYNQSYEMQGKGGISYKWIPAKYLSNDAISNPIATVPDTQLYMLVVKNGFGCADTSEVWLKVKPKLEVKITAQTQFACSGEIVKLQAFASGGDSLHYTYNWQNTNVNEDEFKTELKQSGWVKITLEDGCSQPAKDSILIAVKPTPIAAFYTNPKDSAIEGNKVQFINQSQNSTLYHWSLGNGETSNSSNPAYIYTDTGKYFITLIAQNTNGCSDTAFGNIYIGEKFRIFIPNAFSPDGDLMNDVFSVYGTGIKEYSYEIYNRWGKRVFTSTSTWKNWNGAVENKGEIVQMDIYFYVLKVKDLEGRMHYFNGTVNLLR